MNEIESCNKVLHIFEWAMEYVVDDLINERELSIKIKALLSQLSTT